MSQEVQEQALSYEQKDFYIKSALALLGLITCLLFVCVFYLYKISDGTDYVRMHTADIYLEGVKIKQ